MPPPQTAVLDPEATQISPGVITGAVGDNSFPPLQSGVVSQRKMVFEVPAPAARKSPSMVIIAVIGGVLLLGGGVGAYFVLRTKPEPTPVRQTENPPVSPPVVKAELIEIAGGTFQMGRQTGPPHETPAHAVTVKTFSMDKTEVTNAEYGEFVRETNHAPPSHWSGTKPSLGLEQWPVVNVTFADANAFAEWRSKRDGVAYRLPTEEEWEYAARNGERNDLFPWGSEWKDKLAVLNETSPNSVGSHPDGASKLGVQDLIGNVWEWTSSKGSAYPGNDDLQIKASTAHWLAIRGGGYVTKPEDRDNPVSSCMRSFIDPASKSPMLGFRLVRP
jgi:iron(II)-dependent oxidoreductase